MPDYFSQLADEIFRQRSFGRIVYIETPVNLFEELISSLLLFPAPLSELKLEKAEGDQSRYDAGVFVGKFYGLDVFRYNNYIILISGCKYCGKQSSIDTTGYCTRCGAPQGRN